MRLRVDRRLKDLALGSLVGCPCKVFKLNVRINSNEYRVNPYQPQQIPFRSDWELLLDWYWE